MNRKKSELLCGVREPNKACSEIVLVAMEQMLTRTRRWELLHKTESTQKKGTKEQGKKQEIPTT